MQFSMIFEVQLAHPTRENERRGYHETVEQALLAEEVGFDRVWAVEHHNLRYYAHCTAPEILLTHIAARTKRIRIGHGVVLLPKNYNHPIRVAERIAALDILSGGRVDFGTGVSSSELEMGAFGVDPDTRHAEWAEALRMIPRMWSEAPFSHQGKYFQVPPRHVLPRPVQEPHPPLYVAATREETLDVAGRLGIGALCLGFGGPEDILKKRIRYDRAIAARGDAEIAGLVPNHHLSALCPAIVLEDRELARAIGLRGQRFFVDALNHSYAGGPEPRADVDLAEAARARLSEEVVEADLAAPGADPASVQVRRAFGDPDDAMAYVRALVEAGADEVMFLIQMGTVPQTACLETIRLLGERVIPRFR
jgi:alkanesulfonate monooxygenase SsuD/methylene tetrahydromethanopterin reductase-like flavin-dependent oxidoreductase (luciferase family)